jgi:hypothetical protein
LFVPTKPARKSEDHGRELEPEPGDSEAVLSWKRCMKSPRGKKFTKKERLPVKPSTLVKGHLIFHYMLNRRDGGSLLIAVHRLIVVDHRPDRYLESQCPRKTRAWNEGL